MNIQTTLSFTVTNTSSQDQRLVLPFRENMPEGISIEWDRPDMPQYLWQKGFMGYLYHISDPDLLPFPYFIDGKQKYYFMEMQMNSGFGYAVNTWHHIPVVMNRRHQISLEIPAGRSIFFAFTEEPIPIF